MKSHWLYLRYVLRHKWFVFVAGRKWEALTWFKENARRQVLHQSTGGNVLALLEQMSREGMA